MIMMDFLGINKLLITLVIGIYKVVSYVYQIFLVLSQKNIFNMSEYQNLTDKIYVILGVMMMFVIAYNILTFIVDPEKNKSGSAIEKMLKKIVISLLLIVLCPFLFSKAFDIQRVILNQNIFGNFFDNVGGFEGENSIRNGGNLMAGFVFKAFFVPGEGKDDNLVSKGNCKPVQNSPCSLKEAIEWVSKDPTGSKWGVFKAFNDNVADDEIDFSWLLALVAGGYLIYVIASFCFDLAVRIVKLAFYQIIAPICIACQIIPNKESIFTNWWKAVGKTFIAVFTRLFIMDLGIYLIFVFCNAEGSGGYHIFDDVCGGTCAMGVQFLAYALVVLGIVTFIKQAFKLIDEIFGLGDVKLGLKEKLSESGAFAAGSLIGAGATSLARNAVHGVGNVRKAFKENKGKGFMRGIATGAAVFRAIGSTATGGLTGAFRGGRAGWKAASGADMRNAATSAARDTVERRDRREAYRANHNLGRLAGSTPVIGGIASAAGHAVDTFNTGLRWAGVDNIEELEADNKTIEALTSDVSAVADEAKKLLLDKAMSGKKWNLGVSGKKDYSKLAGLAAGTLNDFNFTLENIKLLQDKIEESKRTGGPVSVTGLTKGTAKLSAEQLNTIFGKYMSDYSKKLADVTFQNKDNFTKTFYTVDKDGNAVTRKVTEDEWKAISGIREKAEKARVSMQNNAGSDTIKAANAEAIRVAAIKQITSNLSSYGLSTANFNFDEDSGSFINIDAKGEEELNKLINDKSFVSTVELLTVDSLKNGDLHVTNDAPVDKIASAGGSIISSNRQKIQRIKNKKDQNNEKK